MALFRQGVRPKVSYSPEANRRRRAYIASLRPKIDRAAGRLAREGFGQIGEVYKEIFGTGILEPAIADAINARVREFRAHPSRMSDH